MSRLYEARRGGDKESFVLFWIRRYIDGTQDSFRILLMDFVGAYDQDSLGDIMAGRLYQYQEN